IQDLGGLHRAIGRSIAQRAKLTGAELRFLRKEMDLSQRELGDIVGGTEQSVSLWERRGKVPVSTSRLVNMIYLGYLDGNVQVSKFIEKLVANDEADHQDLRFKAQGGRWKAAA